MSRQHFIKVQLMSQGLKAEAIINLAIVEKFVAITDDTTEVIYYSGDSDVIDNSLINIFNRIMSSWPG